jgi:hypothetical protein
MSEEQNSIEVELLKAYLKTYKKMKLGEQFGISKEFVSSIEYCLNLIEKQQKEIIRLNRKQADDEMLTDTFIERDYISRDKIREKIKELEEQQEKLKYDGNVCFADYEQFCKNLKFLKEQIEEL